MKINIRTCTGGFGSLSYCAELLKLWLLKTRPKPIEEITISRYYKETHLNILVDETLSSILYERKADVWWSDSPCMLPLSYHNLQEHLEKELFKKHYVTSEFMVEYCKKLNIPVDGVIYRLIHPVHFDYQADYDKATYDIITIGKHCICDRKRLALQRELALKLNFKYCIISDIWMPNRPNITKYNFGTVSDEKKAQLLAKSKFLLWTSFVEGFGLPVLEAMAVGCVPIYTDCPAHNEFAEGIPIPVEKESKGFCYGVRVVKYDVDPKVVEEIVKQALDMKKEEWKDLSEKCKEKAKKIHETTLDKIPKLLEC